MSDVDFSDLNAPTYSGDGVDRARWKFDDDGFAKAMNAALLAARQQLQESIRTVHQDIETALHPSDFSATLNGAPLDKAKLAQR